MTGNEIKSKTEFKKEVNLKSVYDIRRFSHLMGDAPGNSDGHYSGSIQPQHFSASNRLLFNLSNIVKYVHRYPHKGTPIKDLQKAAWYAEYQIIDNNYFVIPRWSESCISPNEYVDAHPEFNDLQIEIPFLIWKYNWQGSLVYLTDAKDLIDSYIKQCQE